ncbi:MAG: hypothetical protein ACK559_22805, partial [bacterium]
AAVAAGDGDLRVAAGSTDIVADASGRWSLGGRLSVTDVAAGGALGTGSGSDSVDAETSAAAGFRLGAGPG